MIYDGIRGYMTGNLNQPASTLLAVTKGPIANRNWYNFLIDPAYSITISAGATGAVALQGTNDIGFRDATGGELNPIESDFLPTDGAVWTDIQAATSSSVSGTFNSSYQFIRLIITTQGTGTVTQAWVRWN